MLAQAVVAAYYKKESDGIHTGQLTVTGVSPCPYATYINYHHLDDEDFAPETRMLMKNGKWQELEVLEDLRRAGFKLRFVGDNQQTVHVGKIPIRGRPDGRIIVDEREDLLEIKAMSLNKYTDLKQKGIDVFPSYKCQVQLYLASEELKNAAGCWFYVKHKDSCRPYDIFVERDEAYSKPIIEAADEIVLGKAEVSRPKDCPLPAMCRHSLFCREAEVLDMSGIKTLTDPEIVKKWLEGQFHLETGEELNEEVRALLIQRLGDNDVLFVEDPTVLLQVKRITQHRTEISEAKFVEKYGAAALLGVTVENIVKQVRVTPRF